MLNHGVEWYEKSCLADVEITAAEEKVRDAKGFEAIREIHKEIDDDHSGSIDRSETSGVGIFIAFMSQIIHRKGVFLA